MIPAVLFCFDCATGVENGTSLDSITISINPGTRLKFADDLSIVDQSEQLVCFRVHIFTEKLHATITQ